MVPVEEEIDTVAKESSIAELSRLSSDSSFFKRDPELKVPDESPIQSKPPSKNLVVKTNKNEQEFH